MTEKGTEKRPATAREVGRRIWLETLNLVAEYGTLIVFSALAGALEAFRSSIESRVPVPVNTGLFVAEVVTTGTMVLPRSIRAVSDVLHVLAFSLHDLYYAFRHGKQRPRHD